MRKINFQDIIITESDDYIFINKPAFIATLADRNDQVNISVLAKSYCKDAQVCHRLDKDTSGVLAIAKHSEAYRHMSIQFEKRLVTKEYHAVADGVHDFNDVQVDAPLINKGNGFVKIDRRDGKDAMTYFGTIAAYRNHTLVKCKPITGRMHQIRVHLSHLKAPITGDEVYGGQKFYLSSVKKKYNLKQWTDEQPLIKRFALHAYALEFETPDGKRAKVEAPYPKDMRVLVSQLSKNT